MMTTLVLLLGVGARQMPAGLLFVHLFRATWHIDYVPPPAHLARRGIRRIEQELLPLPKGRPSPFAVLPPLCAACS